MIASRFSVYGAPDRPVRVVYASRQSSSVADRVEAELTTILKGAVRFNEEHGITGILLAHQGCFLQALEGPLTAVNRALKRIARDRRHYDLKLVADAEAPQRAFPRWSMCAAALSEVDAEIVGVLSYRAFEPHHLDGPAALRLLATIASVHGAAFDRQQRSLVVIDDS